MASTNIQKNFSTVKLTVGATEYVVTSVLDLQVTPESDFERDGSDNDTSFTYIQRKAERNRITVVCRDRTQIGKLANKASGTLTWTEPAATGTSASFSVANVVFDATFSHNGRWDNLREYSISGEGGAKTDTSAAS
jgi:hypothetical protein